MPRGVPNARVEGLAAAAAAFKAVGPPVASIPVRKAPKTMDLIGVTPCEALEEIVYNFKASFPDKWEQMRLCPLQHGLDDMIEALK